MSPTYRPVINEGDTEAGLFILNLPEAKYQFDTQPMLSYINVSTGEDIFIYTLAELIVEVLGFEGSIVADSSKLNGTPRKHLDVSRITSLSWLARIGLREDIGSTYQ